MGFGLIALRYVDDLLGAQPDDWECPQWKGQLTLNHKSKVLLCCSLPTNDRGRRSLFCL
jgi:hypothetical protein